MNRESPQLTVAESYPTFWINQHASSHTVPVLPEEAYTVFVACSEEELPETDEFATADLDLDDDNA